MLSIHNPYDLLSEEEKSEKAKKHQVQNMITAKQSIQEAKQSKIDDKYHARDQIRLKVQELEAYDNSGKIPTTQQAQDMFKTSKSYKDEANKNKFLASSLKNATNYYDKLIDKKIEEKNLSDEWKKDIGWGGRWRKTKRKHKRTKSKKRKSKTKSKSKR